jgi:catechol 2,3-dioxygenase-like lactoylglutathione lyase family enzyme
MLKIAIPILAVASSDVAKSFYCDKLGFRQAYAYRQDPEKPDPCWMGVVRDGAHIVLSSFSGDGPPGDRTVQIYVDDAAGLQKEFREAGAAGPEDLWDQTWGNLEFTVTDPDGNHLIIAQDKSG